GDLDSHHLEAGDHTVLQLFANTFLDRTEVFLRHHTTNHFGGKVDTLARLLRLDAQPDVTVLTTTTGLTHELAFLLNRLADGFAVGNLRRTDVGLNVELTLHPVNDDIEVQFAHAGNNGLAGLFISTYTERG